MAQHAATSRPGGDRTAGRCLPHRAVWSRGFLKPQGPYSRGGGSRQPALCFHPARGTPLPEESPWFGAHAIQRDVRVFHGATAPGPAHGSPRDGTVGHQTCLSLFHCLSALSLFHLCTLAVLLHMFPGCECHSPKPHICPEEFRSPPPREYPGEGVDPLGGKPCQKTKPSEGISQKKFPLALHRNPYLAPVPTPHLDPHTTKEA